MKGKKGLGLISSITSFGRHLIAIGVGLRYLFSEPRMTLRYPEYYLKPKEGYRGAIKFVKEKCIGCSLCAMICPASAMKMYRLPGEKKMLPGINYQRCIFCGYCVSICPTGALEHTWVNDEANYGLEEMVLLPDRFEKRRISPAESEGGKGLRTVFDEEKGLRHVPD